MKRFFAAVWKALKSNWMLKAMSLLFAFIIWGYVMSTGDSIREVRVEDVKISYVGTEELTAKELTIDKEELLESVDVAIMAKQSYHSSINRDTVRAVVDLSGINTKGETELKVQVSTNVGNATVRSVSTSVVKVQVDDLVEREVPVRCVLQGEPAEGYHVGEPALSSEYVLISGPREKIEQVSEAVCYVSVEGISSSINASYMLSLYDADENKLPVNAVNGSVPSVIVKLEVQRMKSVPIDTESLLESITNVKSGYEVVQVTVNPTTVRIVGSEEALAGIAKVQLKPISAENADRSVLLEGELQTIQDVEILESSVVDVYVQIAEKQSEKSFGNVQINAVNVEDGYTASLSVRRSDVKISGDKSVVDDTVRRDINLFVDLSGRETGTYVLPVQFDPIAGISDSQVELTPSSVTVVIKKR